MSLLEAETTKARGNEKSPDLAFARRNWCDSKSVSVCNPDQIYLKAECHDQQPLNKLEQLKVANAFVDKFFVKTR